MGVGVLPARPVKALPTASDMVMSVGVDFGLPIRRITAYQSGSVPVQSTGQDTKGKRPTLSICLEYKSQHTLY